MDFQIFNLKTNLILTAEKQTTVPCGHQDLFFSDSFVSNLSFFVFFGTEVG